MEQEMMISSAVVRRLRTERGWSQDQLATASGLSLRTIQRVEADGNASQSTRVSLAATFGVQLSELSTDTGNAKPGLDHPTHHVGLLFTGIAVLACVLISESGRMPGLPASEGFAAINILLVMIGALLTIPSALRLIAQRHYAGVMLAALGTPLVVLLAGGLLVALFRGNAPMWQLGTFGIAGACFMAMALRQFGHRQLGRASG